MNISHAQRWRNTDLFVIDEPLDAPNGRHIAFPYGFNPTLHRYRLDNLQQFKTGVNVFVCSMADLFGAWVPNEWIQMVMDACAKCPQNNYLFLTKNPARYGQLAANGLLPHEANYWYGTTVTRMSELDRLQELPDGAHRFVSIEPILEPITLQLHSDTGAAPLVDWIIVGPETGNRKGKVKPERSEIISIVQEAKQNEVPVFLKNKLAPIMGEKLIQEFPQQLQVHRHVKHPLRDGCCSFCKQEMPKKAMMALLARERRGAAAKAIGYACPDCYAKFTAVISTDKPVKGYEINRRTP
jgi:protein gp37